MFHSIARFSGLALTLAALLLTPTLTLAGNHDRLRGDIVAHRPSTELVAATLDNGSSRLFQDESGARLGNADVSRVRPAALATLIREATMRGELTTDQIQFLEHNIWDAEAVAQPATIGGGLFAEIERLFGTAYITNDMIRFYQDNFWLPDDDTSGGAPADDSFPKGRMAGQLDE